MELFFIVIYIWFSCWMLLESIIFATDGEYNQTLISYLVNKFEFELRFFALFAIIPVTIIVSYLWLKDEL